MSKYFTTFLLFIFVGVAFIDANLEDGTVLVVGNYHQR